MPQLFEESSELLETVSESYRRAESYLTYVSNTLGDDWGHDIATINQLRYAGRHLIDALGKSSAQEQISELRKCKSHAQRAVYDALEAGNMVLLIRIDKFIKDYSHLKVTDVISNYAELRAEARELAREIGANSRDDGDEYFNRAYENFKRLEAIFDIFESSIEDLNVMYSSDVSSNYFKILGLVIAGAAVFATIIAALL